MSLAINEVGNTYGRLTVIKRMENRRGVAAWLCKCLCGNDKIVCGTDLRSGNTKSCGCASRLIDETGNKYGRLTVLKRDGVTKDGSVTWLCRCDCGNTLPVNGSHLRQGFVRSCGCLRIKNEVGNRYGRLIVVSLANKNEKGPALWLCKCDCGNEVVVRGGSLRNGDTRSCGCLLQETVRLPYGEASLNALFSQRIRTAKARGYVWNLTKEQMREITQKNCYYCGIKPQQILKNKFNNGDYIYNGLDRIDNSKGYTIDNVVPCCKICNYAKRTQTPEQFREWIIRIHAHYIEGKESK